MPDPNFYDLFDSYDETDQLIEQEDLDIDHDPVEDSFDSEEIYGPIDYVYESSLARVVPAKNLSSNILIHFKEILRVTQPDNPEAGALLLSVPININPDTIEMHEVWVPKKVCRNVCISQNTIYIWETFWESKLKEIL